MVLALSTDRCAQASTLSGSYERFSNSLLMLNNSPGGNPGGQLWPMGRIKVNRQPRKMHLVASKQSSSIWIISAFVCMDSRPSDLGRYGRFPCQQGLRKVIFFGAIGQGVHFLAQLLQGLQVTGCGNAGLKGRLRKLRR